MFGSADAFIDQRLALGRVAFPLADLVKETGLSVTAARNQLLRLENAKVVRFLNGNYWDFLTEFEAIAAAEGCPGDAQESSRAVRRALRLVGRLQSMGHGNRGWPLRRARASCADAPF